MPIPVEFAHDYIAAHSSTEQHSLRSFLRSGEPFRSMLQNNPWLEPPDIKRPLDWGTGRYWDTTVARKHPYWQEVDLPAPTKRVEQLRQDLDEWGYCLIEEALSRQQCAAFLRRLLDQAAGEREAGVEQLTPSGQYVNTLINKGECFVKCIEQDPSAVQAGPVIEQLMNERLGKGWICHSFLANGADPGGYPQGLHIDQGPLLPWVTEEAPVLVNTMFIPQDVNEQNGGTLFIPGSHRILCAAGPGGTVGQLPPAINLEATAGTVMVFDGRLVHGTGANRSDERRFVATMSNVKPWMRQQENWIVSTLPEVIDAASDKLLHRMGMQALTYGATIEGFGLGANGRSGDPWGNTRPFRRAIDRGDYVRVGELSPDSTPEELQAPYTVKIAREAARRR